MREVVVRIPDEILGKIIDRVLYTPREASLLEKWIYEGTPLPKGHGDLIDRSLLREDMERAYRYANELVALGFAESFIEHATAIIGADKEVNNADSN